MDIAGPPSPTDVCTFPTESWMAMINSSAFIALIAPAVKTSGPISMRVPISMWITTQDRMLSPPVPEMLACLPAPRAAVPPGRVPPGPIIISGAVPIWLLLSYLGWLRSLPGDRRLGVWDARTRGPVWIAPRGPGPDPQVTARRG